MTRTERENELFRVIARQTLERNDAAWLADNIRVGMDWPFVGVRAFNEGIAPLLYYHCRQMDLLASIPGETKKFLARIYAETSLVNMHLMKELEKLERELEKRDLRVIVLKGAALLKTVYRDVALRPMEDIDLMVRQENMSELKNILEQMGFVQNRLYQCSFRKGIISIDIHSDFLSSHRILCRQDILDIDSEDVWGSVVSFSGSNSLYRLPIHVNLIALSFHLLKHRYDRLIWFVDIAETIKAYQSLPDWEDLIAYSRRVHADKLLLYTLILTKRLLGGNIPEDVLIRLRKKELSSIEKYMLRLRLMHVPLGTVMDLLWMFQLRGVFKKTRFIRENIFPRQEVMDQIFTDSPPHVGMLLRRSFLLSSQVLSDLQVSLRGVLRGGLPPL
jgi:hypothetical protein